MLFQFASSHIGEKEILPLHKESGLLGVTVKKIITLPRHHLINYVIYLGSHTSKWYWAHPVCGAQIWIDLHQQFKSDDGWTLLFVFTHWLCFMVLSYWTAQLVPVDVARVSSNRFYIELDFHAVTWKHDIVDKKTR